MKRALDMVASSSLEEGWLLYQLPPIEKNRIRALEIARQHNNETLEMYILLSTSCRHCGRGEFDLSEQTETRGLAIAERRNDQRTIFEFYYWKRYRWAILGDSRETLASAKGAMKTAQKLRSVRTLSYAHLGFAKLAQLKGDWNACRPYQEGNGDFAINHPWSHKSRNWGKAIYQHKNSQQSRHQYFRENQDGQQGRGNGLGCQARIDRSVMSALAYPVALPPRRLIAGITTARLGTSTGIVRKALTNFNLFCLLETYGVHCAGLAAAHVPCSF